MNTENSMSESNSLNLRDALKGMAAVSLGIATGAGDWTCAMPEHWLKRLGQNGRGVEKNVQTTESIAGYIRC